MLIIFDAQAAVWQAPSSLPAVEAIKPENLLLTATRVFSSSEVDELLALSKTEKIKDALKTESAKAVEEGAFGFVSCALLSAFSS